MEVKTKQKEATATTQEEKKGVARKLGRGFMKFMRYGGFMLVPFVVIFLILLIGT